MKMATSSSISSRIDLDDFGDQGDYPPDDRNVRPERGREFKDVAKLFLAWEDVGCLGYQLARVGS